MIAVVEIVKETTGMRLFVFNSVNWESYFMDSTIKLQPRFDRQLMGIPNSTIARTMLEAAIYSEQ